LSRQTAIALSSNRSTKYGALFRTYSTDTIRPELLAALAQGESFRQSGGAHLLALAMEASILSRSTSQPPAPSACSG
jgi:hypothetical protein